MEPERVRWSVPPTADALRLGGRPDGPRRLKAKATLFQGDIHRLRDYRGEPSCSALRRQVDSESTEEPGAAPQNTGLVGRQHCLQPSFSVPQSRPIPRIHLPIHPCAVGTLFIRIMAPLPDVPMHVVQTKTVHWHPIGRAKHPYSRHFPKETGGIAESDF